MFISKACSAAAVSTIYSHVPSRSGHCLRVGWHAHHEAQRSPHGHGVSPAQPESGGVFVWVQLAELSLRRASKEKAAPGREGLTADEVAHAAKGLGLDALYAENFGRVWKNSGSSCGHYLWPLTRDASGCDGNHAANSSSIGALECFADGQRRLAGEHGVAYSIGVGGFCSTNSGLASGRHGLGNAGQHRHPVVGASMPQTDEHDLQTEGLIQGTHKSVYDWLKSKERSGLFWVDEYARHATLAMCGMRMLEAQRRCMERVVLLDGMYELKSAAACQTPAAVLSYAVHHAIGHAAALAKADQARAGPVVQYMFAGWAAPRPERHKALVPNDPGANGEPAENLVMIGVVIVAQQPFMINS